MTRVAVIGAGAMGRNHVRVYREMPHVELVGIADADEVTVQRIASPYGTRGYTSHREMFERERPDAVSVAVPTQAHLSVVQDALEAGCHVLVEKPIAATLDEADQLLKVADLLGRILMVGHVERFNPAIVDLKRRLIAGELGRVFQIHARRLGPFPARVRDVGVVVDLATHDLDVMRFLIGNEPVRAYAETQRAVHTTNEDLLSAIVRFQDDTLGVLEINWLTPTKIRELVVTGERGMFRADYLTQDLYFFENSEFNGTTWSPLTVLRGVSEGAMTRFAVRKTEPLRAELDAFVAAVQGDDKQVVSGADGRTALSLALALIQSSVEHRSIDLTETVYSPNGTVQRV